MYDTLDLIVFRALSSNGTHLYKEKEDPTFEIWVNFMVFFVMVGALANGYFFVSVLYARVNQRHGFEDSPMWFSQTLFLINLSLSVLLYCIFWQINGFIGLTNTQASGPVCKFVVLTRQYLIIVEGWCTCVIAFNASFSKIS